MTIPASHIVKVSPRVIGGGRKDLETLGMLLTKSALLPSGAPAQEFLKASDVASVFGDESDEAKFAQQYFTGVTNQQRAPRALVIGRCMTESGAAWVRSAPLSVTLEDLKKVTDGHINLVVNGETKGATGIDLSRATSLSDVAAKLAEALGGLNGAYDGNQGAIILTTTATGKDATISFTTDNSVVGSAIVGHAVVGKPKTVVKSAAESASTDLNALLGLTLDAGAVVSPGYDALTASAALDAICSVTRNWVGFTSIWEATLGEAEGFAAWADIDDDYVYFDWTTDRRATNPQTSALTKPAKLMDRFNCTAALFGESYDIAAFALACGASIAWDRYQGMKVWFAKGASNLSTAVTDEAEANALEAIRCSYYGNFATRNARFNFFNRGTLASDFYGFIDVLYGSIYLRNSIQRSCMDGFKALNRVPYNAAGQALISAWLQDPINACLNNGVIDTGMQLDESQKAQIMQELGTDISTRLFTNGFYYQIEMPAANVRADRGSPVVSCYYAYAGSVQALNVEVVSVL